MRRPVLVLALHRQVVGPRGLSHCRLLRCSRHRVVLRLSQRQLGVVDRRVLLRLCLREVGLDAVGLPGPRARDPSRVLPL
jgi:hypothetical protein